MDVLKGKALSIKNTVEVRGGSKDNKVSTTHITLFLVDKVQVKIESSDLILLNEGDHVCVVGKTKHNIFNGRVFKNMSTGVTQGDSYVVAFIVGVSLPVLGVFMLTQFSDPFFGVMPQIVSSVLALAGAFVIYNGLQVLKASKMLKLVAGQ